MNNLNVTTHDTPWSIQIFMAIAGWLAAGFLLGLLVLLFSNFLESSLDTALLGMVLLGIGIYLLRSQKNDFMTHAGLACSLAGQALLWWALNNVLMDAIGVAAGLFAALQCLLIVLVKDSIQRFIAATFLALSLAAMTNTMGLDAFYPTLLLGVLSLLLLPSFVPDESEWRQNAIVYGLAIGLLLFYLAVMNGMGLSVAIPILAHPLVSSGVQLALYLWLVVKMTQPYLHEPLAPARIFALLLVVIITVMTVKASGLSLGIMIVVLGFAAHKRLLMAIGAVLLLGYGSYYYYLMDLTLLHKAGILAAIGLLLLAMRWAMLHMFHSAGSEEA